MLRAFYPRGVCLFVFCPSVCLVLSKRRNFEITKSSLKTATRTIVLGSVNLFWNLKKVTRSRALNEKGKGAKIGDFEPKTSQYLRNGGRWCLTNKTSNKLFQLTPKSTTLNDLEPSKWVLVIFWRFYSAAHILRVNCTKMARNRLRQPAYEVFLALNVDFNSLSLNPLGSRRPVQRTRAPRKDAF